jgi:large-conductance mechanosensitive channel
MQAAKKVSKSSMRESLGRFLTKSDLLPLMLAVYLGEALGKFFNSIVNGAVLPLIAVVFETLRNYDGKKKKFHMSQWTIDVYGANIHYGAILAEFINMMVGVYIAYLFVHHFILGYLNH